VIFFIAKKCRIIKELWCFLEFACRGDIRAILALFLFILWHLPPKLGGPVDFNCNQMDATQTSGEAIMKIGYISNILMGGHAAPLIN
jgi:hypothetical protein